MSTNISVFSALCHRTELRESDCFFQWFSPGALPHANCTVWVCRAGLPVALLHLCLHLSYDQSEA